MRRPGGMRSWQPVLVAGFLLMQGGLLWADDLRLASSVDKDELSKGERLTYHLQLEWEQEQESGVVVTQVTPPASDLLEFEGSHETSSSRLAENKAVARKDFYYRYRAVEKGEATLSPAVIEYVHANSPDAKKIAKTSGHSIKIVAWPSLVLKRFFLPAGILSLLLTAIGAGFFFFRTKQEKKRKKIAESHSFDLERELLQEINNAHPYRIGGDFKKYYGSLLELLSSYIRRKYGVQFSDEASEDIRRKGSEENIDSELLDLYVYWQGQCEKVRFSGYRPGNDEMDKMVRQTEKYFKSLIPTVKSEEMVETVD